MVANAEKSPSAMAPVALFFFRRARKLKTVSSLPLLLYWLSVLSTKGVLLPSARCSRSSTTNPFACLPWFALINPCAGASESAFTLTVMSTAWSHFRLTEKFLKDIPVADSSTVVETLPNGIVGFLLSGVQGNTLTAPPAATEIAKTGSVWLSSLASSSYPYDRPFVAAPMVIGPVFSTANCKSSISTVLGHLQLPKLR